MKCLQRFRGFCITWIEMNLFNIFVLNMIEIITAYKRVIFFFFKKKTKTVLKNVPMCLFDNLILQ